MIIQDYPIWASLLLKKSSRTKNLFTKEIQVNKFLLWFAYFLVFTTPIQIIFCLWVYSFLLSVEYSLLTFSTSDFMDLTFLRHIKIWMYSWFWNDFLNFMLALPAAIVVTLRLLINTWLGFWLLPIAKKMKETNTYV